MDTGHREALSRSGRVELPAMRFAREAGLPSLRAVARALEMDPGFLSKAMRGICPMPARYASAFERLTGFPAGRWKNDWEKAIDSVAGGSLWR